MLAPWIIDHFSQHRIYTEVFGGAASVLLRKPRSHSEVYNDLDGDLVNLFRLLQRPDEANDLRLRLHLTTFSREEFEATYLPMESSLDRAWALIVRSFFGHGSDSARQDKRSGFRAGGHGGGSSPARDWKNYPPALEAVVERLQGVLIEHRPAVEVLQAQDSPDTLHYVDPPYVLSTRKMGGAGAYRHELTDQDHRELAAVLRSLKGHVIISGYPCKLYDDELYADWSRVQRSALADGARERNEVLWMNAKAWSGSGIML